MPENEESQRQDCLDSSLDVQNDTRRYAYAAAQSAAFAGPLSTMHAMANDAAGYVKDQWKGRKSEDATGAQGHREDSARNYREQVRL